MQRCHTGVETRDDILWLNPCLPNKLPELRLRLRFRGHWLRVHVTHDTLAVSFEHGWSSAAKIGFRGKVYTCRQGEEKTLSL
jgi:trehalose/maltose hydrolase-like predicted phosphorylase